VGHEDQSCDDAQEAEKARRPDGFEMSFVQRTFSRLWGRATGGPISQRGATRYKLGRNVPSF
jgi:hypothetical protein